MRAGEECSDCHQSKLPALWGRSDVMIGHLWTDCSCGEPGSVATVIKVNGSGSLVDEMQFYNHSSAILKPETFLRHISRTKQNTQLRSYLISAIHSEDSCNIHVLSNTASVRFLCHLRKSVKTNLHNKRP